MLNRLPLYMVPGDRRVVGVAFLICLPRPPPPCGCQVGYMGVPYGGGDMTAHLQVGAWVRVFACDRGRGGQGSSAEATAGSSSTHSTAPVWSCLWTAGLSVAVSAVAGVGCGCEFCGWRRSLSQSRRRCCPCRPCSTSQCATRGVRRCWTWSGASWRWCHLCRAGKSSG